MRLKIQSEEARSRLQTLEGIWARASSHTQEITKGAKQATTCLVHAATELVHAKERDQGLTWTDVFDKCLQMETQVFRTIYFHNRQYIYSWIFAQMGTGYSRKWARIFGVAACGTAGLGFVRVRVP